MENKEYETTGTFATLLEDKLSGLVAKRLEGSDMTQRDLKLAHADMHDFIVATFNKGSRKVSDVGFSWLTDQFFKEIKFNVSDGTSIMMTALVVMNEHPLSSLPFKDIELFRNLFLSTTFGVVLEEEYRRRSRS